ncbi:mediator of rna polymerase ii transcription subunit 17 [Holotrichia oblita]|uniref:Mediator of rna polymerase ii transcription subunit 17 n=1 Tax=Holotrichia oblita TaxID=644536 RepID=A0ACB9TBB4_HOLOL|nr:mediator of rna polymerase ii transcription subunit 17 [Holotrichia oblita]
MQVSQKRIFTEKDIRKWFLEIETYINETNLGDDIMDPSRVYNGDETGFQICPKTGKVYTAKGAKNVDTIDKGASKESITVMFTFSGSGTNCCPMVGTTISPKWGTS